ncbi:MAG: FAD-dependent monooxygenase [Gloeomargarita sp. DG02_5_bins_242]
MAKPHSSSVHWDYDVLIVGGSLVGLTLAAWLGQSGMRVLVIESQRGMAGTAARVYALMPLTQRVWETLGVWPRLAAQVQTYNRIDLSDRGRHNIIFTPADLGGKQELGYVAEHRQIWPILRDFVREIPSVTYWEAQQLLDFVIDPTAVTVNIQSNDQCNDEYKSPSHSQRNDAIIRLSVGLIVGADGAKSQVRQQAGIKTWGWSYWQSCVTTVIQAGFPPIAYERFWPAGPLALLPLPEQRWGIVWTLPHAQANDCMALPAEDFLARLKPYLPFQEVHIEPQRWSFPVAWRQARRYVQTRLALVGDAAHGCHPVGGQGLNWGIRDAATLGEILVSVYQRGGDVGAFNVLKKYERWRWPQNLLTLLFTDSLNRVFSQGWEPLVSLRALLLKTMQRWGALRRLSLHFMAGLWGKLPDNL